MGGMFSVFLPFEQLFPSGVFLFPSEIAVFPSRTYVFPSGGSLLPSRHYFRAFNTSWGMLFLIFLKMCRYSFDALHLGEFSLIVDPLQIH